MQSKTLSISDTIFFNFQTILCWLQPFFNFAWSIQHTSRLNFLRNLDKSWSVNDLFFILLDFIDKIINHICWFWRKHFIILNLLSIKCLGLFSIYTLGIEGKLWENRDGHVSGFPWLSFCLCPYQRLRLHDASLKRPSEHSGEIRKLQGAQSFVSGQCKL